MVDIETSFQCHVRKVICRPLASRIPAKSLACPGFSPKLKPRMIRSTRGGLFRSPSSVPSSLAPTRHQYLSVSMLSPRPKGICGSGSDGRLGNVTGHVCVCFFFFERRRERTNPRIARNVTNREQKNAFDIILGSSFRLVISRKTTPFPYTHQSRPRPNSARS